MSIASGTRVRVKDSADSRYAGQTGVVCGSATSGTGNRLPLVMLDHQAPTTRAFREEDLLNLDAVKTCETCWCEIKPEHWDGHVDWHRDLRGW